jgi:hypothetical protein
MPHGGVLSTPEEEAGLLSCKQIAQWVECQENLMRSGMSPKEEQNCHCREPGGAVMAPSGVQGCGHMVWLQRSREWEVGYVLGF